MSNKDHGIQAAVVGATAGSLGTVGVVYTAGTVTGLSTTGITSGLSAVGATIGGGMAAGFTVTAIAPLVLGAVGYGLYDWLKD